MNEDQDVKVNPDVTPETKTTLEETAAPVETSFASPAKKKHRLRLIIAALIAAAIIVLIGGTVFGYSMWYQNPDKIVHDGIIRAIKAQTASATGKITYASDAIKMDITLDSKSAEGDSDFSITAKLTVDSADMKQDFNAAGTGRIVDDTLYIKVSGVQSIVEDTAAQSAGQIPEYAAAIFEKIEDRWISIKPSDYQQASEEIASQQACLLDLLEKAQKDSSMSDEVANLYRDNQVIIIKEELGSKEVNGVNSFGYKVEFDQQAANSFVGGLANTTFGKELKMCNGEIDFRKIKDDINQRVSENKDKPVKEIWVSQFGHEITEIAMYGQGSGADEINITLQPIFDEAVTVEIPENATSFKTVLGEIQEVIIGPSPEMFLETMPAGLGPDDIDPALQSAV